MAEPVVVFVTPSDIEASVVRSLLDAHGIHAAIQSDVPNVVLPLNRDALGTVRVSVRAEDATQAQRLIADYRSTEPDGQTVRLRDEFEKLSAVLGHRFRDPGLLEHALTHRSRANEDVTGGVLDNESLEFLGDAALGFVIAAMLFERYPDRDEGQKSKMKAALVSTTMLARLAERLRLGDHLLLGRGEEKTGGRRKQALLADTYEAVIAALYLDGGLDAARTFIVREFDDIMRESAVDGGMGDDHKSVLQEFLQSRGDPLPEYVVVAESGPAHRRVFLIELRVRGEVIAVAEGRTKKDAEQEAARLGRQSLSD
ncbi:MAG: ribonuclease III [Acidobacteria bacterium]|nr:ribonuclease III [Acidobacteriota bacterium]